MTSIDKLSIPPLIPEDTKYRTNETRILKTVSITSDTITDGVATLSGGTLSGLSYPINETDVANKEYVDDVIADLGGGASLPVNSVQYATLAGTWTSHLPGFTSLFSVTWSPELAIFAAVGTDGLGNGVSATSTDAENWTTSSTITGTSSISTITWSPELSKFVAIDGAGSVVINSTNGLTWTTHSPAITSTTWTSVAWSDGGIEGDSDNGIFVAVAGVASTSSIMISSDGATWTSITSPVANKWKSVIWAESLGLFVATSEDGTGNQVMTSSNGTTWITRSTPVTKNWNSIAWSSELSLFVVVGIGAADTNNRIMTSSDGITWISSLPANDNAWQAVSWSPELKVFAAVSKTGTGDRVMVSTDGTTWETQTTPTDEDYQSIVWGSEVRIFSAVSATGTGRSMKGDVSKPFAGDSTFTYASDVLTVTSITDGTATLTGGVLSNLVDPVNTQDAATKNYVDDQFIITRTTIDSVDNQTYTASQMVNGLITRIGSASTLVDLTSTAEDIVASIPSAIVGSRVSLSVKNESTDDTSKIIIAPNLGVTIHENQNSIVLFKNYQTNIELIVTNATSGSEAITMLVLNTLYIDPGDLTDSNLMTQYREFYRIQRLNIIEDYLMRFSGNIVINDSNYTYSREEVLDGLVLRGGSLTSNRFDTLPNPSEFTDTIGLNDTGITFSVQNVDPTFYIRVSGSSSWTNPTTVGGVSDSTRIIPPGKTGIFVLNPGDSEYYTLSIN